MNNRSPILPESTSLDWEKITKARERFQEGMRRLDELSEKQKRLTEELFRLLGLPKPDPR